jgi:hypothetical protein
VIVNWNGVRPIYKVPGLFGQALEGAVDEEAEGLLVRFERDEWVDAVEGTVVGGDFVVEVEGALVMEFFEDGDAGVIAGGLDREGKEGAALGGERREDASRSSDEET